MNILLIGDLSGNLDEGMKNTTFYLQRKLSKHHKVMVVKPRETFFLANIKVMKRFDPNIIHYVHGSSIRSFIVTKLCSKLCPESKTVISMMHPELSYLTEFIAKILVPDLVLVQSPNSEHRFLKMGVPVRFLPNGVDLTKFIPSSALEKEELRRKYGLLEYDFIGLHVGPIRSSRNLEALIQVHKEMDIKVIIAGSTTVKRNRLLLQRLKDGGCIVWPRYFEKIEELYKLSDCYLFPVKQPDGSVDFPLTVLEAMASNLPVVTTRFGGLPSVLKEGDGLYYVNNADEMLTAIQKLKEIDKVNVRSKVEGLSWELIVKNLDCIYTNLLN